MKINIALITNESSVCILKFIDWCDNYVVVIMNTYFSIMSLSSSVILLPLNKMLKSDSLVRINGKKGDSRKDLLRESIFRFCVRISYGTH